MWIIAGPNGAGKSTFTEPFLAALGQTNMLRLNADEVTAELRAGDLVSDQNSLNLRAAKIIDAKVVEYIEPAKISSLKPYYRPENTVTI